MKKAIQVMATLVAFLLSGQSYAARIYPTMPPIKDVFGTSSSATIVGDGIKVTGSGTLFPKEFLSSPINKALAVVPETTVSSAAISSMAKNVLKGGLAGVAVSAVVYELVEGVGWVIDEAGKVNKPGAAGGPVPITDSQYYRYQLNDGTSYSSAAEACQVVAPRQGWTFDYVTFNSETSYGCHGTVLPQYGTSQGQYYSVARVGSGCPANSTFSSSVGACLSTASSPQPLVESDYDVLDGFVKGKDGVWQRDLSTSLCAGSEVCFQSLSPETRLTGPSVVTGTPQTSTTTSPSSTGTGTTTATTTKTPTATVTYGPNYYDTTTTTTTTTNNGGNTTTTTADTTPFPNVPDMLGGANGGFGGLRDGIPGTTSATSPIPYMPWYSFSQQCNEITLVIPVYGAFETALCPIYSKYIWPVLYFIFAVYTWVTCWGIWRNTVLKVRAS